MRICGGKHTEEMAVSVSVSQKNERILQYYNAGMTILGNEAGGAYTPGRRVRARHGKFVHGGIVPGAGERAPFGLFAFAG